jgi:hypothetical protein
MNRVFALLLEAVLSFVSMLAAAPDFAAGESQKAIVLVQGGFVGGSGSESSLEEGW